MTAQTTTPRSDRPEPGQLSAGSPVSAPDRAVEARPGGADPGPVDDAGRDRSHDDAAWLLELLGDDGAATWPVLARPALADPQLVLPVRPRAAAAASLRRLHGDRSLRARLELGAGRALARLGLLALAPGEATDLPRPALVDHLARCLGEPELTASITIGPPRRNRKPVLQLLRPDGRVVGFAKVGWSSLTRSLVAHEAEVLRLVERRLPPSVVAPAVVAVERWRDLVIAVTAPLPAAPRPVPTRRCTPRGAMAAIAAVEARPARPVPELATIAEARALGTAATVDLDRLADRHGAVRLETGLWHGDFTPWNRARAARSLLVWDWEFAGRDRPVGFDPLHQHFEQRRRAPGGTNRSALRAVEVDGPAILGRIGASGDETVRAIVDVYLCELVNREHLLTGQRWSGGELATLGREAADLLATRLA